MPEGPEVRAIALKLNETWKGKTFEYREKVDKVINVTSHGKWLIINLEGGRVSIHFMLRGKLEEGDGPSIFEMKVSGETFRLTDPMKAAFATDKVVPLIGLDPIDEPVTPEFIGKCLDAHKGMIIGNFLSTQGEIVGIGSRMRSEILYFAKIRPDVLCKDVTRREELSCAITSVMKEGVRNLTKNCPLGHRLEKTRVGKITFCSECS